MRETSLLQAKQTLSELLSNSIKKNAPKEKFGLLFSGGIDSTLLALFLRRAGLDFRCFFAYAEGIGKPRDLEYAQSAAKFLGLGLELVPVRLEDTPLLIERAVKLTGRANPIDAGVALPILAACESARKKKIRVVFSGMGADELFLGYAKFRASKNLSLDSKSALAKLQETDFPRDSAIASSQGLELKTPFLDKRIIEFAFSLPNSFKLVRGKNKIVLREIAKDLGLPKELAERGKVAAQYGSNFDKAIEMLARKAGFKTKSEYLASLSGNHARKGMRLASLFSGGKDSCLALWLMQKQGYEIACLLSILPKNPDSFMYHKPDPRILKMQSACLGIPLLLGKTRGEKEKELYALRDALESAKARFGVQGVVSGALYSNYQRERIQKICSDLGLKLFSPLWHKKQLEELHELEKAGFIFVMSKVAGMGLGEKWLGKRIGKKEIAELAELERRFCFNVAGEGGEFESIVLDAPNFRKRIALKQFGNKMLNEFTGSLKIGKAVLESKNYV